MLYFWDGGGSGGRGAILSLSTRSDALIFETFIKPLQINFASSQLDLFQACNSLALIQKYDINLNLNFF